MSLQLAMRTLPAYLLVGSVGCAGCDSQNTQNSDAATVHSAPWRRDTVPLASAKPERFVDYRLGPAQEVRFVLKTKKQTIEGRFPVLRGSLSLDLMQLSKTTGKVEVDVASARLSDAPEPSVHDNESRAQNWLNVGASKSEAERERLRWAKFLIEGVDDLASEEAHSGKKRVEQVARGAAADTEPSGAQAETRLNSALAVGTLELNDHRVTHRLPVSLEFKYGVAATPGATPERIVVATRRPMPVPLRSHDVAPRDAHGEPRAEELGLIGKVIGRTANVTFELNFVPHSD